MIDGSLAAALARVADRAHDVLRGYDAGFEPLFDDVRAAPRRVPDARPLSVTAPDGAYFVVRHEGKTVFTRDGAFRFEAGTLRTSDGSAVLGHIPGEKGAQLTPLRVDAVDAALGRVEDPQIDANGAVTIVQSVIDPKSGGKRVTRCTLGTVALASFPAGTRLTDGAGHNVHPPAGVHARVGAPADGAFAALTRHARELGSVDLETGLHRLQEAYLSLEALQSAYRTRGELDKGAMDLLK